MIATLANDWTGTVHTALDSAATQVVTAGVARWTLAPGEDATNRLTATIAGPWLVLETDLPPRADALRGAALFWDALAWNASLPGLVKVVLGEDDRLRLRADVPLQEGVDLASRIRAACAGFESACGCAAAVVESGVVADVEPVDLKRLCSESGWPFQERTSVRLAVDLEVPGAFHQALVVAAGQGVRVSCELACELPAEPAAADVCQRAMGGLLLGASRAVRLVRAAMPAGEAARFEVVFADAPAPAELANTFECLSAACSLCGEEIKALQNQAVAQHHLGLRGWM